MVLIKTLLIVILLAVGLLAAPSSAASPQKICSETCGAVTGSSSATP